MESNGKADGGSFLKTGQIPSFGSSIIVLLGRNFPRVNFKEQFQAKNQEALQVHEHDCSALDQS